jgi:HSF-type DNA-binding
MNNTCMNFAEDRRILIESSTSPQTYQQQQQQPHRFVYQNQVSLLPSQMIRPSVQTPLMTNVVGLSNATHNSMLLPSTDGSQAGISYHINPGNLQFQQQLQQLQVSTFNPAPVPIPQHQQLQPQPQLNPDMLRSYVDHKMQQARYEDQWRQRLVASPADPLMQNAFIGDGSLLMVQNPNFGLSRTPLILPSPHELSLRDDTRRMRGGVIEPFPEKLHRLLIEMEQSGRSDVISFIANGQAFAIHKPDKFFKEIVPKYFRQSRLSSFKRQLNLYGFELINTGPARGGYYHEMFVKDRAELCRRMRRVAVKLHQRQHDDKESNDKEEESQGVDEFYNLPSVIKDNEIGGSIDRHDVEPGPIFRSSARSA